MSIRRYDSSGGRREVGRREGSVGDDGVDVITTSKHEIKNGQSKRLRLCPLGKFVKLKGKMFGSITLVRRKRFRYQ